MTDNDPAARLRAAERRLQAAQLGADVGELDRLLDDRLRFTGPDGRIYSKQDDLAVHRSGRQVVGRLTEEELVVLVEGSTGVTWCLGSMQVVLDGVPFDGRLRYTRTWVDGEHGWRLLAGHVSPV